MLMSDQRIFTDYRSSCVIQNELNKKFGIADSNAQRLFLQRNGQEIMNLNRMNAEINKERTYVHVDPHGHDESWKSYKDSLKK